MAENTQLRGGLLIRRSLVRAQVGEPAPCGDLKSPEALGPPFASVIRIDSDETDREKCVKIECNYGYFLSLGVDLSVISRILEIKYTFTRI